VSDKDRRYYARQQAKRQALPKIECRCGCGTLIAPVRSDGAPAQYALGHNETPPPPRPTAETLRKSAASRRRPGNEWRLRGGYVRVTLHPDEAHRHPTAKQHGRNGNQPVNHWSIQRSHLVWNDHHPEDPVRPGEHVHHLNHVRDDDWPGNLVKLVAGEHLSHHARSNPQPRDPAAGRFVPRLGGDD
jgi:hypothetical protein